MRPLARAAALAAVATFALPGCIVAIGTSLPHDKSDEETEAAEAAGDAEEAEHDSRLLDLEKRMDRLEEHLPK
jgi:hypothetical protein